MYWFIALFDEKTEQQVKDIWSDLSEHSISFYAEEVKDGRPHITLGSYESLDKKKFIDEVDTYYNEKDGFEITFNTIGSFLDYGAIFLTPTVTQELLTFHSDHYQNLGEFNEKANSLYLPGKWIPHCTLANDLSHEDLAKVYHHCIERNDTIYGRIEEVALIELIEEDEDGMNAPIIYSKRLK